MSNHTSFTTLIHANVERMRQGDQSAADELFRAAASRLRRLAQAMLNGYPTVQRWNEVDDLLQNASLRLWRALDSVRPDTTRDFLNLAAVQMRRELIDMTRSLNGPLGLARRQDSMSDVAALAFEREGSDDLQQWSDLHAAAARLPAAEREVFDLVFYHGCQQSEVAELCQVNVRTVRRRWASAIVSLQSVLTRLPLGS